jgi:hypothetical protein
MISKKDTYKLVIYDLLIGEIGEDDSPLNFMEAACDSYLHEFAKVLLGPDAINMDALKEVKPSQYDVMNFVHTYFKGVDGILEVFDDATSLYDALYVCAQYQVLSDMDAYFHDVLMEIANDYSLPRDLRNAARESAECYGNATEEMLQQVLLREFVSDKIDDLLDKAVEKLWKSMVNSIFPGLAEVIQLGAKGILLLVDAAGFNMDAINEAYFQLEAAVGFENALRNVIQNKKPDYLRYEMFSESDYYMYAVGMYKTSVLLGYDYSNALLKELHKGASASEKDDYEAQMRELSGLKQEKEKLYNNFDATVSAAYETYCK